MSDWQEMAIIFMLALTLSTTVVAVIRRPLFAVLQYVCGTDIGAKFWTAYSSIMIVIGPVFLVAAFVVGGFDLVRAVRATIATTSFGLIGAFVIMGLAVSKATRPQVSAPPQAKTED